MFGVLNLLKPQGITSRDLVNRVQRLVRPDKVGHAGTLDPMATGVLLVCIGPATKLTSLLQQGSKTYVTEFLLGMTSDTDDITGQINGPAFNSRPPSHEDVVSCLASLTGQISQVPPNFSAVHVNGRRAYDLARRGEILTLQAKDVRVDSIRVLHFDWPKLALEIVCGSGTYIRSIARDLGQRLGCGGLMSRLERTRINGFQVTSALREEDLTLDQIQRHLRPPIDIVSGLPMFDCEPADVTHLQCGRLIRIDPRRCREADSIEQHQTVALTRGMFSELLALAEIAADGYLQPRTVFLKDSAGTQA